MVDIQCVCVVLSIQTVTLGQRTLAPLQKTVRIVMHLVKRKTQEPDSMKLAISENLFLMSLSSFVVYFDLCNFLNPQQSHNYYFVYSNYSKCRPI